MSQELFVYIIATLYSFLAVLLIIFIVIKIKSIRQTVHNNVDKLFDNTRFLEDAKSARLFKKALWMLTYAEYIHMNSLRRATVLFVSIAQRTADPLDKAYCFGWAGRCFEQTDEIQLAVSCYISATEYAPSDVFALERLGDLLSGAKEYDKAVEHYKKVLKYDPLSTRIHYKLGKTYSDRANPPDAIKHYKSAMEVHNGYVAPMAEVALEYAKTGDKANALKYYHLAIANDVSEFDVLTKSIESALKGATA
jgi:tetratricopeptide (TPR) repeat protein